MYTLDISDIFVWYWILAIVTVGVTVIASLIHRKWMPGLWGITIGSILVCFAPYLEPALFGWNVSTDWLIVALSFTFFILWGLALFQGMYNSLRYGKVVA